MKLIILFPILGYLLLIPNGFIKSQSSARDFEIHALTRRLCPTQVDNTYYGPSIETQEDVREKLLAVAYESTDGRNIVIQALIDLLNDAITRDGDQTAWYVGTELLGRLKATEAIDLLVTYIDYSDGTAGLSLGHIPSAWALVEIGEPAVPKLIAALRNGNSLLFDDNSHLRVAAVRALGNIGGSEAKQALKQALKIEKDAAVISYIKLELRSMREQSIESETH